MNKNFLFHILLLFLLAIVLHSCKFFNKKPLELVVNGFNVESYGKDNGSIEIEINGGKAPYTFLWSTGDTSQNIYNLSAGTYLVTVTDHKNKSVVEKITITQPEPECVDADGNSYNVIEIGSQTWMAENLRTTKNARGEPIKADFYENDSSIIETFGMLYNWSTAMNDSSKESSQGICPNGWHIPSYMEWQELFDNFPSDSIGYLLTDMDGQMKVTMSGFKSSHTYHGRDYYANFWTSTKSGDNAWKIDIYEDNAQVYRYHGNVTNSYSVRCVKDN
jgi:uncharacterized protein (TIGR02145 family)